MKKILAIAIALILSLSSFLWGSCSKQLSVDEYLQETKIIIEAYNQSTKLESNSIKDATAILEKDIKKGYAIIEVTEHLYAEDIRKYYQVWNEITPPKEFAEYHSSVANYFNKLENNSRMISTCAENLLDGKETDTTRFYQALDASVEIAKLWDKCSQLAYQALLKTSRK